ncbi:MAG TPA: PhzF family phenazine biosynthesis protein [Polyangia bacterium]|nr:PhzF family phenazine biosynthesis protein [Polyangia bacterium]
MPRYRFLQVDVFTDTPFAGNPLCVVLDGRGLSDALMQAIAREKNLSETTFILPPTERAAADARVRIFTPQVELPFAGHPVVGTAFVLANERLVEPREPGLLRLQLGVGVVPVDLRGPRITMTQKLPELGAVVPSAEAARVLGLAEDDVRATGLPAQTVSTGLAHLVVPVRSLAAMRALRPDLGALPALLERAGATGVYAFSRETETPGAAAHARMFAPAAGVLEDPATGSAAGPLGAYLVEHGAIAPGTLEIEQGLEMGRPSRIFVEIERAGAAVSAVRVGGQVVQVMEGAITV